MQKQQQKQQIPSKVVFLDVDGVLTSKEDGTSYECLDPKAYGISEKCFGRLKRILDETGASVVISSNWRRFAKGECFTFGKGMKFENQLPKLKKMLGDKCFGDIPHDRHITKSAGIILWGEDYDVDLNDTGSFKYVIFDDMGYEMDDATYEMLHRFIHCNSETGLTDENAEQAIKLLND